MTNGILKSINTKDTLYKKLVKVNIDDEIAYTNLKAEFTDYKKILRRSINEAKHAYYQEHFEDLELKRTISTFFQKWAKCTFRVLSNHTLRVRRLCILYLVKDA